MSHSCTDRIKKRAGYLESNTQFTRRFSMPTISASQHLSPLPGLEPVGEAREVLLIDGLPYIGHGSLDDFVLSSAAIASGRFVRLPLAEYIVGGMVAPETLLDEHGREIREF